MTLVGVIMVLSSKLRSMLQVLVVWAQLILGRFRDDVLSDSAQVPTGSDAYLNAFFTDPRRGGYRGRYVPGA